MMNSLISFKIRPALLVIIPVVLYSMLHASSYSLKLLDLIGQNRFVGHTVHHLYCGVPGGQRTEGHRLLRDLHYALHHCAHLHAPVYSAKALDAIVECQFTALRKLCADVSEKQLLDCLKSVLHPSNGQRLPRPDESLLVLAIYLSMRSDERHLMVVRGHFVELVRTDKQLLLFIRLVKHVQKLMKRKTLNRTVRKAVLQWYKHQTVDGLLQMWSVNGQSDWGMHRELLHRCHHNNNNNPFDAETMAALYVLSSPVKELVKWPACLEPVAKCKETILGIAKLRAAQDPSLALVIIRQLSLSYEQVPLHFMTDVNVANFLYGTMSFEQLLQHWPTFQRLDNANRANALSNYAQHFARMFNLRASDVEPFRLLLQERRPQMHNKKISVKQQPSFVQNLYKNSFGFNKGLGLRLHITINLEMSYMCKSLTGRWTSIKYLDAVVALAFGYFMSDNDVTVRIWHDKSGALIDLPWLTTMSVDEAKATCEKQKVLKIKQTLTDVLDNALDDKQKVYDVFLVLVPCATRGNPKNNSEQLCQRLDQYREKRNTNARFIIMSLRQHRASMSYSTVRNEHILEICSISEQTTRVISAFAHGNFF
ncbi:GH24936 [Drosophila grimshawi]|uniref:GH24936 n=1 Tax=Drosophila grimshawi TaxID=7222 RepID=B4JMD9_DROGR|nr:GH24936 [Drosophila grimshawi]